MRGSHRARGSRSARRTDAILATIAGLATAGLLPWLGKPTFPDERASLHAARLGWAQLWQHSRLVDLVLLPYYSLLHEWTGLSGSIEWARLLSLLAFGLTVFLVGHLGGRLGGRVCAVLAATVAATNPLLVTAALSARPYALSALAATAAIAALFRWLEGGGSRWAWTFCAASMATLCLHLFAVLAPLSVLVAAIVLEPGMFRGRWRQLLAPLGLLLAVSLVAASLGVGQRSQIAWIPTPFGGAQLIRAVEGPAGGGHAGYVVVVLTAAIASAATCLWARRGGSRRARLDLRVLGILLAWAALPTATLVAASLVRPVFLDRYVTASVPGLAIALGLLVAWAIGGGEARFAHRPGVVAEGVLLGVVTVVLFFAFSVPAARLTYAEAVSRGAPRVHRVAGKKAAVKSSAQLKKSSAKAAAQTKKGAVKTKAQQKKANGQAKAATAKQSMKARSGHRVRG